MLDVAGGLEATLAILSRVQVEFRTLGASLFAADDVNESDAMVELCLQLNQHGSGRGPGRARMSRIRGMLQRDAGNCLLCSTRDIPPAWFAMRRELPNCPRPGCHFGLFSHATSDARMVALAPGAALLLASRGIIEGKRHGDEYGLDRLKENFRGTRLPWPPRKSASACSTESRQFMGTAPTHDDVTTLALARSPSRSATLTWVFFRWRRDRPCRLSSCRWRSDLVGGYKNGLNIGGHVSQPIQCLSHAGRITPNSSSIFFAPA